jgi:hypothetical protein
MRPIPIGFLNMSGNKISFRRIAEFGPLHHWPVVTNSGAVVALSRQDDLQEGYKAGHLYLIFSKRNESFANEHLGGNIQKSELGSVVPISHIRLALVTRTAQPWVKSYKALWWCLLHCWHSLQVKWAWIGPCVTNFPFGCNCSRNLCYQFVLYTDTETAESDRLLLRHSSKGTFSKHIRE